MADEQNPSFTEEQMLQHLFTSSIRMEAAINVLVHSQAALLAKAYETGHEEEHAKLNGEIEKFVVALVKQAQDNRQEPAAPQRAKVRDFKGLL